MSKNLDSLGIKSIVSEYDLFFIDIWGVVHNGINLFNSSIEVLDKIEKLNKKYVLLTNAPRPNVNVRKFLENMGLDKQISSHVYTSGEAALKYLLKHYKEKKFFHIGPKRDFNLFKMFEENKVNDPIIADYLLCTGLFEKKEKDLNYHETILKTLVKKKMICTNPDLIVDKGDLTEYCAGSIAKIFEKIGGEVEYFGKPYLNVYNLSTDIKNKRVLCIGDNLNTDIKGANAQNFDSLFISSGIHKNEIIKEEPMTLFNKYNVDVSYIQNFLKW